MDHAMTVGAVDVHYDDEHGTARAALVVCRGLTFADVQSEHVADVARTAPYEPGALYKRELPCIAAVLALGPSVDLLVIDGYATLDADGRPGLGAHASEALRIPVIGVAKTRFRTAAHAAEVVRGAGVSPLYVTTAGGLDIAQAARIVSTMAGRYRIPDALRRADRLARGLIQPRQ
ncbi:MAG: endonuclease V [Arachnia sp.]